MSVSGGITIQDFATSSIYHNFLYPIPYTLELQFVDGPDHDLAVVNSCSKCGDYGLQDLGSKF